ncbi:hypothetical protein [Burkholderia ubonensis]|nr:hypothetical protein [Burkholderia ubonensis]
MRDALSTGCPIAAARSDAACVRARPPSFVGAVAPIFCSGIQLRRNQTMKRVALAALALTIASGAFAAKGEIKVSAEQMIAAYTGAGGDKYFDKPIALTGTLLGFQQGFTGATFAEIGEGEDAEQAVRATFADTANEQKAQRLVGKQVTLHCRADVASGIATASNCRLK